jgi:acetyl esterase/lipase
MNVEKMKMSTWIPAVFVVLSLGVSAPVFGQGPATVTPDVVYGHKDGMALTFDVFTPSRPNGAAVLHIVSGGWVSRWAPPAQLPASQQALYEQLFEQGFTVFAVRHGSSPRYQVPEIVPDVQRAVRFIRLTASRYGIDPDRLGVTGMSAGGHLSLMIGLASDAGDPAAEDPVLRSSDRVAAVAAYYAPVDLDPAARAVLTDVPTEGTVLARYPALKFELADVPAVSPVGHVSPDDPPTLLIHGTKDERVPIAQSERIYTVFQQYGVPSEFVVIDGAGHGFTGADADQANAATAAWFTKHLTGQN